MPVFAVSPTMRVGHVRSSDGEKTACGVVVGVGEGRERRDRPLARPISCPTPSPARPLGAAERRKEPPLCGGTGGRTPGIWARHAVPLRIVERSPTSRKTAGLAATAHKSRVNANTVHLAATDARIGPWDSKLIPKVVGTRKVAKSGPQGRDMSRPYMTGAMQKRFGVSITV